MAAAEPRQTGRPLDETIDRAVEDSFPASDPPAFQAGLTSGGPNHAPATRPQRNAPVAAIVTVAAVLMLLWAVFG